MKGKRNWDLPSINRAARISLLLYLAPLIGLLELAGEVLPIGEDSWEELSSRNNENLPQGMCERGAPALHQRVNQLARGPPTGGDDWSLLQKRVHLEGD